jgi:hypothetical protein
MRVVTSLLLHLLEKAHSQLVEMGCLALEEARVMPGKAAALEKEEARSSSGQAYCLERQLVDLPRINQLLRQLLQVEVDPSSRLSTSSAQVLHNLKLANLHLYPMACQSNKVAHLPPSSVIETK